MSIFSYAFSQVHRKTGDLGRNSEQKIYTMVVTQEETRKT
jgi:hypothetical protein